MDTRERDRVNKKSFFLLLMMALLAGGAGVAMRLRHVVTPHSGDIRENFQYDTASGAINILLIGVDETDQSHRADSLAVVRINVDSRHIRIMSVPRDTRVQIPGHGWQKINHAFAFGGVELVQKTIINFLGILPEQVAGEYANQFIICFTVIHHMNTTDHAHTEDDF